MKHIKPVLISFSLALSVSANAAIIISDVSYTSNSVSFTIDGDFIGYTSTVASSNQFSLRYIGDIWVGPTGDDLSFTPNNWTDTLFDNETLESGGNTGLDQSINPYSWYRAESSLRNAIATNNSVTLMFGEDWLNIDASNPVIEFVWGNGHSNNADIVLYTWNDVPEPSMISLMAAGLVGLGFARRKAKK